MPVRVDRAEDQWKKMFIGGLTYATTDEMLKDFYSQFGQVTDCIVMKDPQTKKSRGFGFVTYADQESVDKAMNGRPHTIDNKQVEPKRAIPRDPSGKSETNISVKRLYVSGVREEHTDDLFKEHFGQYGNITEVDIIVDKNTGKKRGFAFVTFDDYDAVDKCVLQKSHMIDNKRCDVKKALSKEDMKKVEMNRERLERDARSRGTARGDYGTPGRFGAAAGGGGGGGDGIWNQGSSPSGWGYGSGAAPSGWGGGQSSWGPGGMTGGYGSSDGRYGGGYSGGAGGGWSSQSSEPSWSQSGSRGPSWGLSTGTSWQGSGSWGGQQQGGWGGRR